MDANSFVILAAVVTLFSFNLTASLMCCRSLGKRVDRLENHFDKRIDGVDSRMDRMDQRMDRMDQRMDRMDQRMDRIEQRMDRMEQLLMQLVVDMGLVKAKLGIETASPAVAPQTAIAPESEASSGAAAQ